MNKGLGVGFVLLVGLLSVAAKAQHKKGKYAGSWGPVGVRASEGGRVYTTALMAIGMQIYNRYGRLAF